MSAEILPEGQPIEVNAPPPRPTKADLKRQEIFRQRMGRLMAKGMTEQQAFERIQREDYERLPVAERVKRLEAAIIGNFQAIGKDIHLLRGNESALADVMDVNFRAFEKMLVSLGLPVVDQRKLLVEAEAEIRAEREAAEAARKAAQAQQQEQVAQETVQETIDVPGTPEVPEGAVVHGG
jgi:hypothetical protein